VDTLPQTIPCAGATVDVDFRQTSQLLSDLGRKISAQSAQELLNASFRTPIFHSARPSSRKGSALSGTKQGSRSEQTLLYPSLDNAHNNSVPSMDQHSKVSVEDQAELHDDNGDDGDHTQIFSPSRRSRRTVPKSSSPKNNRRKALRKQPLDHPGKSIADATKTRKATPRKIGVAKDLLSQPTLTREEPSEDDVKTGKELYLECFRLLGPKCPDICIHFFSNAQRSSILRTSP
jgi:hypothetical protein